MNFGKVASSMKLLDSYAVKCPSDATTTTSTTMASTTTSSFREFEGDSPLEIKFIASLSIDELLAQENIRKHFMNILPNPVVTLDYNDGIDYEVTVRQSLGQLPENLIGNIAKSIYDILPGLELMGVSAWSDTVSVDFDIQTTTGSTATTLSTITTQSMLKSDMIKLEDKSDMVYLRLKLEHLYIETKDFRSDIRALSSVLADQLRAFYNNLATILATNTRPKAQEDFSSGFEVNVLFMVLFNEDHWNSNHFDNSMLTALLQSGCEMLNQQTSAFYIVEDSFSLELIGPDIITLEKVNNVLPKRGFYDPREMRTTTPSMTSTTTPQKSVFTRIISSTTAVMTSTTSSTSTTTTSTTTTSTTTTSTITTTTTPEQTITRHFIILDILYQYLESDIVEEGEVWRILDGLVEVIELEYSDIARLLILEEGNFDKYSYSIVITTKSSEALPIATLRSYFRSALSTYPSVKGLDARYQGGITQSSPDENKMTTLEAQVQIDLLSSDDIMDFDEVMGLVWDALQSLTGQISLYQITDLIPVDERTIRVHVTFDVNVMENAPDDDIRRMIEYEVEFITQYAGLEISDLFLEKIAVLNDTTDVISTTSTTTTTKSQQRTTPAPKTPSVLKLLQAHVQMYEGKSKAKSPKKSKKKSFNPIQIDIPVAFEATGNEVVVQISFEAALKKKIIINRLENVGRPYQGPTQESSIPGMTLLSVSPLTEDGLWSATFKIQMGSEDQPLAEIDTILNARMITEKLFPTGPATKLS
ncbi:Oidioi.mRNA.OKI2018_I69.PAR.g10899.t1.cds [Oikopleura dioica]|uniref:Oidioi.mRNA.OKI2018_I69.PAR.g10899.t1.cds n=1 Tax=Oikopleura dioica TaxID=34765 RepID=A0ABN7RWY5_OIKDI|nr:Oidioi.mRNA.OKI2018_I69.PAR.g10899.t1.cds [Oikopleura dioica]